MFNNPMTQTDLAYELSRILLKNNHPVNRALIDRTVGIVRDSMVNLYGAENVNVDFDQIAADIAKLYRLPEAKK
ncbi:MAG: hypothetical protein LRZ84_14335 [Desertifilum sp.]|nr:hypothetical protein [Desertifilum sp.]